MRKDLWVTGILVVAGLGLLLSAPAAGASTFVINEFLAKNDGGLEDGFGRSEDWLEIRNLEPTEQSLEGYYLTDDEANLTKWRFPAVAVDGYGYLVVFASGNDLIDSEQYLHTNFSLRARGEYLALVQPDGVTIEHEYAPAFPEQFSNVSYGLLSGGRTAQFYDTPTPGTANGDGYFGVVADTQFSIDRGLYDAPFDVEISSATTDATIRYTLDGSKPTTSHGAIYTGPIRIAGTSTLRAMAYKPQWLSTNVDTQTYIFPDEVAMQPPNPPGWPAGWGYDNEVDGGDGPGDGTVPADYEMDLRVVLTTLPDYSVRDALLDIPSLCVSMPTDDFVGANRGIYSHPKNRGSAWERECSLELIDPDGIEEFQLDCKIEIHGNSSRRPWRMQKHSLRVTFTSEYGPAKLEYPLFWQIDVEEFNKLVLRACFTDSWGLVSWSRGRYRPNDSQYIRDVWMKESLAAMGQPSSFGRFVHLYVNGLYWGLYNLTERFDEELLATHLGGEEGDWEINSDFGTGGRRWNQMMAIANAGLATPAGYEAIKPFLDLENFCDYVLLHLYADAEDWPHHNGYAAANANSHDGKFRFFVWDQEIVLDNFNWNRYDRDTDNAAPGRLFQRLRQNADFRLLFADRVHKHLFNGGALSLEASQARYLEIANWIDKAIVAESARWGDVALSTPYGNGIDQPSPLDDVDDLQYPPAPHAPDVYFTREDSWLVERDNILDHYLPVLHDPADSRSIVNELRREDLYPPIDAPEFNQHGGPIAADFLLEISAPQGVVYYTLDGTDPRLPNSSAAMAYGTLVTSNTARDVLVPGRPLTNSWITNPNYDTRSWLPGTGAVGYDTGFGYQTWINIDVQSLMYANMTSCYVRIPFECDDDPSEFNFLTLRMLYDDGFIAYLNGVEIQRRGFEGDPQWNSAADTSHEAGGFEEFDVSAFLDLVQPGTNLLAIHGLNTSSTSSDFLIGAELLAAEQGQAINSVSPSAILYEGPIALPAGVRVKARCLDGDTWSALTEATFTP